MKNLLVLLFIAALSAGVGSAASVGPTSIRITPPAPKFTDAERHAELAKRRAAVAAKMSDKSMLILFSAESKLYTNDVDYVYRQENNLYYLTALKQIGATLVIAKEGGNVTETLFLPRRVPIRETWEGRMYSREDATRLSGINNILDSTNRIAYFDALKALADSTAQSVYLLLPQGPQDRNGEREFGNSVEFSKQIRGYRIENAQPIFADLRHIKSPYELKILQHAIDISTEAHMRAMATVGRASMEYEVQAEVEYTFRRRNADYWGYPSIVGCGPNATTLHYVESQGEVKKGDLLLMDVGAEYDHYTADITRTFPVNGKFSKEQAEIYQIVFDAQEAAAKATKPGATFQQISAAANDVIRDGLLKLGLITEPSHVRIWYMHGLGHWLGMNVHDVGRYGAPLQPGMVFTNEPGIYIREDALDNLSDTPENKAFIAKVRPAFEKYKNIGVRIEDDMLVTATGVEWMSKDLPRTIADIENFMAKAPKEIALGPRFGPSPVTIFLDHSEGVSNSWPRSLMGLTNPVSGRTLRSGHKHSHPTS
jgi:Xaa-Pro aminopeptidase